MTPTHHTAPGWGKGETHWRVELLGKPRNGNVLVRWVTGPLKGREARLVWKALTKLEE